MKRPLEINIVIGIGIFAFAAIVAYWVAWYLAPEAVQSRTPADADYALYVAYEEAFPLPDSFAALAALIGVIGLWKMRDWGFLSMLVAAGATMFLGLEDLLFDLQHNMFTPLTQAAAIEVAIVLLIMSLGPSMTYLLWKHRHTLIK
jgi:hypothetical protein